MKIETLKSLYEFIINGGEFEQLENNCERCGNDVYEDEDFNTFLSSIKASVKERSNNKITLSDNLTNLSVDYITIPNRFDALNDEIVLLFDSITIL